MYVECDRELCIYNCVGYCENQNLKLKDCKCTAYNPSSVTGEIISIYEDINKLGLYEKGDAIE